jgi:tetratricopeptide (TPR) repeat protein
MCASVAGERFSVWAITSLLDIGPEQIEDLCDQLCTRQHVIKSAGIQELPNGVVSAHYEFRHSLYRQAIYRFVAAGTRSRLHRGLADRLQTLCTPEHRELATEVAFHFEEGRDHEPAIRYLLLAAENAARRFAYRDSVDLLQRALELASKPGSSGAEQQIRILEFIGDAHYAQGAMAESAKAYGSGVVRAAEAHLKAARVGALTCLMQPFGLIDPDRGLAALAEAEELSRRVDDPLLVARTQMLAASCRLLYETWRKEDADLCTSAHQKLCALGDLSTPPYHVVMYAYVQALQGSCQQALEIVDMLNPTESKPISMSAYLAALGVRTVALLRLGRFGDVLQIVRTGKEMAQRNGSDPWLLNFREAWLRTLALDFEGVRQLCEFIMRPSAEYPTSQPTAIASVAAGYAEFDRGRFDEAIEYFKRVRDPQRTPKFFLHWFWRITAQLGLSKVWLESGNVAQARAEADAFLQPALSTADPHLQALAWEMKTRIAIAEEAWDAAADHLREALSVVECFAVPVAAWQVHATAWDFYRHAKNDAAAESNRAFAEAHILAIVNSFTSDEPLRGIFLSAAPVRRVLDKAPTPALAHGSV